MNEFDFEEDSRRVELARIIREYVVALNRDGITKIDKLLDKSLNSLRLLLDSNRSQELVNRNDILREEVIVLKEELESRKEVERDFNIRMREWGSLPLAELRDHEMRALLANLRVVIIGQGLKDMLDKEGIIGVWFWLMDHKPEIVRNAEGK